MTTPHVRCFPDPHSITACEHLMTSSVVLLYVESWWAVNVDSTLCHIFFRSLRPETETITLH